MNVVLYTVNFSICVFMTCSTSYCLNDTLVDPQDMCVYVCVFVCMHAYMALPATLQKKEKMEWNESLI
jgi:hypothetical protein